MSKWFKKLVSHTNPVMRLFCFPYAGGNAHIYSDWADKIPDDVDLYALQSPGRMERFVEKPISCLDSKTSQIHNEIVPFLDVPSVFFGYSIGALVAFDLALKLNPGQRQNIRHMILAAKNPPHLSDKLQTSKMSDTEFREKLESIKGTPEEVLQNKELMDLFMPVLRADFELGENYKMEENVRLDMDVSLFSGTRDEDCKSDDVNEWVRYFARTPKTVEFEGGHFFINERQAELLNSVNQIIVGEKNRVANPTVV